MFSGTGPEGLDGTAWYHPLRLTIDSGAVAAGNPNPAQQVLAGHAVHGDADQRPDLRVRRRARGQRVLDAARALAQQSGLPASNLTLIDRQAATRTTTRPAAFPAERLPRQPGAVPAEDRLTS